MFELNKVEIESDFCDFIHPGSIVFLIKNSRIVVCATRSCFSTFLLSPIFHNKEIRILRMLYLAYFIFRSYI